MERVEKEEEERQLQAAARRLVTDTVAQAAKMGTKRLTMGPANTSYEKRHINIIEENNRKIAMYDQQAVSTAKRLTSNAILNAQKTIREKGAVTKDPDDFEILVVPDAIPDHFSTLSKISSRNSIELYGTDDHRFGDHRKKTIETTESIELPKIHHGVTPHSTTSAIFKPGEAVWKIGDDDDDDDDNNDDSKKSSKGSELPNRILRKPQKFRHNSTKETYSSIPQSSRLPKLKFNPLPHSSKVVAKVDSKSVRVGMVCPRASTLSHNEMMTTSIYVLRKHYNSQDCCVWDSWIPMGGRRVWSHRSNSVDMGSRHSQAPRQSHAPSLTSTLYSKQRETLHADLKASQRNRVPRESVWQ